MAKLRIIINFVSHLFRMKNIVLVGSGNVATHLGLSLVNKGYKIKQVWSRKRENANILAERLNANAINSLNKIKNADLYILAIKDDALKSILNKINVDNIIHTSGSIDINVFEGKFRNYGVFYPLQTFNKQVNLDFSKTPICIEANNKYFNKELLDIGKDLSEKVVEINSQERKKIHLAAVFACNFTNHMFAIADAILNNSKNNFQLLLPLINQTVEKIKKQKPSEIQTGPAARKDLKIIQQHIDSLSENRIKEIYKIISYSIMENND